MDLEKIETFENLLKWVSRCDRTIFVYISVYIIWRVTRVQARGWRSGESINNRADRLRKQLGILTIDPLAALESGRVFYF